jgi:hypothetical protein
MKHPCWSIRGLYFTTKVTNLLTVFQDAKLEHGTEIIFRINLAVFSLRAERDGIYQANCQSHSGRQSIRPSPTSNNSSIYLKKKHENAFHNSTQPRFELNISGTGLANYYCASLLLNRHHTVGTGTAVTR